MGTSHRLSVSAFVGVAVLITVTIGVHPRAAISFGPPVNDYFNAVNSLSLGFGQTNPDYQNKMHTGEDIPGHALVVTAVADGTVMLAGRWRSCPNWGHVLVIEHQLGNGQAVTSIYGHLDASRVSVVEGQTVAAGEAVGMTGQYPCWGEHLHFAIHDGPFAAAVGTYPAWLTGYLASGDFPAGYLRPVDFIRGHSTPVPNSPEPCTYSLSIGSTIAGYPQGGSFPVTVTTGSGCQWTASTSLSWIHLPLSSGTGTTTFTFNVDANPSAARSGSLMIAGQTVVLSQDAAPVTGGGPLGGTWNGSVNSNRGTTYPLNLNLVQTGQAFSGTWALTGFFGGVTPGTITGSVSGLHVSLSLNMPPSWRYSDYTCTCSGSECPSLLIDASVTADQKTMTGTIVPPPGNNVYGTCNPQWGYFRGTFTVSK